MGFAARQPGRTARPLGRTRLGRTRPPTGVTALLTAAALALAGCGGGGDAGSSSSTSATAASNVTPQAVKIVDYTYKPETITVPTGATVEFDNKDSTAHTATSTESGAFESGAIQPGESGSITLRKAGTFAYYCAFHPFMKGKIVVR
jgi:plastocyanin